MKKPNNIGNFAKILALSAVLVPAGLSLVMPSIAHAGRPWVPPEIDQEIKDGEKKGYEAERQELTENTKDAKDDAQEYNEQYYGLASDQDQSDPGYTDGPFQVAVNPMDEPKYASDLSPQATEVAQTTEIGQQTVQRIRVKDAILSCKIESTTAAAEPSPSQQPTIGFTKVSYSLPQTTNIPGSEPVHATATGFTQVSFMGNARPDKSIKPKSFPDTLLAALPAMPSPGSYAGVDSLMSMPGMPKELAVIAAGTRTPVGQVQELAQPAISTANQIAAKIKATKANLKPDTNSAKSPKNGPKDLSNGPPAGKTQKPQKAECGEDAAAKLECQ